MLNLYGVYDMIIAGTDATHYLEELDLIRPEANYRALLCLYHKPLGAEVQNETKMLHVRESVYYQSLQSEKRKRDYLMGRVAAKKAVGTLTGATEPDGFFIQSGIFTQPVLVLPSHPNVQVSITHSAYVGGAIAFPEVHPMGIDLERIIPDRRKALENQMTETEKNAAIKMPTAYDTVLMLLWTAKEALSKVLKTGMMTPFSIFEVDRLEENEQYFLGYYRHFAQYKVVSFVAGKYACSITFPKKTEVRLDFQAIKDFLLSIG